MSTPLVTINLAVYNGEKYIRQCLDSVLAQTYPHENMEINIWDNTSTDSTILELEKTVGLSTTHQTNKYFDTMIYHSVTKIIAITLFKSAKNLGMWPAQEELLKGSHGKYVVVLSVDVILHPDFIKNAVEAMEHDPQIGALQAKVYQYRLETMDYGLWQEPQSKTLRPSSISYSLLADSKIIDTLGFQIFRSRRIVNIGHGEADNGQFDNPKILDSRFQILDSGAQEIFAVEGAVPVFRRQALEDCRLESQNNKIVEPDFFWYGDDLDLAWRMSIFGWKQVYAPNVIAWHDRKTTKTLAGGWGDFIKIRKTVPMFKRRLDWRNTTLTIIKNDFVTNILRDLPYILWRQLRLWAYFLIFEPAMFLEIFNVAKMLPKMLKRRREIMKKTKISAKEFRTWIT